MLPGPAGGGGGGDGRERSGSKTPTPQGTPTRHRRTTSDMAGLPPGDRPPDNMNARHSFAGPSSTGRICDSDSDDSDDGSWPPPPPADFMTPAEPDATDFGRRGQRGSVSESHSGVMQSLNAVFGGQSHPPPPTGAQMWHPDSLPLTHPHAPSASNHTRQERALSQSSDDVTPTAEAPPTDNLMNQIKRGVSLRRTTSNDRSAPRLPNAPR